ncbi:MAG TPA: hypothetical protein VF479_07280 [Pseudolysinimonas sp.]
MPDNAGAALSKEERAAVKERARELKEQTTKAEAAKAVDDAIAALPADDRYIAERLHAMVRKAAPHLDPKTYYGMPAYANADGKVVCFFQPKSKFKVRYGTFGFETAARLDDGEVWPTAYAVNTLSAADEAMLAELVKKAAR